MIRPLPLLLALLLAVPAAAQTLPDLDKRVTRLEREVSRVSKKVLPKGEQTLIEPEIAPAADAATPPPPAPATASSVSALADRVDAIERRQRELTAGIEEQGNRLKLLEDRLAKFQPDAEARLGKLEGSAAPAAAANPPAPAPAPAATEEAAPPPAKSRPGARKLTAKEEADPAPAASDEAAPTPVMTGPDARYKAAFALVEAKKWGEAEPALQAFIDRYPKDKRVSGARYWLGRTAYAQGQFDTSARTHFANYKADPKGERAQESLFWVGQSLMRLKKAKEACQVYDLARQVYADTLKPELRSQFAAARTKAGCS